MSMSIMFEKRKKENEMSIPKTTPSIWIPSKNVNNCFKCKKKFTIWNRKHHCRVCGRVFCYACADSWGIIPSLVNITSPPHKSFSLYSYFYSEKRMCKECKNKTDFIKDSQYYIYIFTNLPITLKDLYRLRLVNKEWCKSINTILSFYKGIQYKLSTQQYSKLEKQLLWNHRFEFIQHFQLMSKCLSSFDFGEKNIELEKLITFYSKKIQKYKCNELACKRNCSSRPKIEELLEICQNNTIINNKKAREWIYFYFKQIDIKEINLCIPWLINICLKNSKFINILIPLCIVDKQLIFTLYFECKFLSQDKLISYKINTIIQKIFERIDTDIVKELKKTHDFILFINENIVLEYNSNKWNNQVARWFEKNGTILLPWDITIECIGVCGEGVVSFNSNSKPWKIPLIVKKNNKECTLDILVKFEDVRKDKLSMILTRFIKNICGDLVNIKTYNVFPVHDECGWIEMINNSNTLYDIKYKYNTNLQNYIMDFNPNIKVTQLRDKFIKTCVSSCVLSYILGVGDRHLENILVTNNGLLLHIDFSYILGDDPKNLQVEMKITEEMLDMLGGISSKAYKKFKSNCLESYKKVRRRASLWYILLSYLVFSIPSIDNFKYNKQLIENHIIERLLPGENDKEATLQIIDIVDRSSRNSWKENLTDFSHKVSNTLKDITQFNIEL